MKTFRTVFAGLAIACSMYSRIPMPRVEWTDEGMEYALCFFPLIGIVIGAAQYFFFCLSARFCMGRLFVACIGTVIPVIISGGIHMDGFLDTADALGSCESRERRLEIMKDPHAGAFAIISCCTYFFIYAAAYSELESEAFPAVCGIYAAIRAASGSCVINMPKAKKEGLASVFSRKAKRRAVNIAMVLWEAAAFLYFAAVGGLIFGLLLMGALALLILWFCFFCKKNFGGITGDLAGFFLQVAELALTFLAGLLVRG